MSTSKNNVRDQDKTMEMRHYKCTVVQESTFKRKKTKADIFVLMRAEASRIVC